MKLDTINSTWIKDLNNKTPRKNVVEELHDIGLGSDFLDVKPKTQVTKANNEYTGLHQALKLMLSNENNQQNEVSL